MTPVITMVTRELGTTQSLEFFVNVGMHKPRIPMEMLTSPTFRMTLWPTPPITAEIPTAPDFFGATRQIAHTDDNRVEFQNV